MSKYDYCHYENVPGVGRVFFPGCMGGAVWGDTSHCTCARPTKKDLEQRMAELEKKVKQLEKKLQDE